MPTEIMSLEQRSRALLARVADGTASRGEAAESMLVEAALAVLGHRLLPPGTAKEQVANAAMEAAANGLLTVADGFRGDIDDDLTVCRSMKALKDSRGLVIEVGGGGLGQGAFKRALRHLRGHRAISMEEMPAEFAQAFQQPYDNPEQAALDPLLDEEA